MRTAAGFLLLLASTSGYSAETMTLEDSVTSWPFRFTASTHALLTNRQDSGFTGPVTRTVLNETRLRGEVGKYTLGVGLANRLVPQGRSEAVTERPVVLEKAYATYEGETFQLRLGDSSQELGRGIALSLYRDQVFGIDNTLQGAAVRVSPHGWETSAFAGRVHALQAPVALNPTPSPISNRDVWMTGGALRANVAKDTKVGVHALYAMNQPNGSTRFDQQWLTTGGAVQSDGIFDAVDVYAESNVMSSRTLGANGHDLPQAWGNYASVIWSPLPWKLKAEVKDYRKFGFDLNRPPNLEEDVVASLNTSNVTATRLYAERRLGDNPKNMLHASYLYGWDYNYLTQVNHGVVGGKFVGPWDIEFQWKTGYRRLPGSMEMGHVLFKGKLRTGKGQSLEIGFRKQYTREGLSLVPVEDDRNYYDLAYVFSERWTLNVGYEFMPTVYEDQSPHFFNVGGTAKLGPLSARAFVGQTSGGFLCSGGVCRQIPPYTGAYMDATVVF